jgi:hypothetical protein
MDIPVSGDGNLVLMTRRRYIDSGFKVSACAALSDFISVDQRDSHE